MPAQATETGTSTRDRILEAARTLIYERGYEATSLKELAAAAGVHGGSLYHFFPTKSALVEAVLESYLELLDPVLMEPARAATEDPLGRVEALLGGYRANLIATEFSGGCPIGNLALELAESQPAARELVAENFVAWRRAVAGMLEPALARGVDGYDVAGFVLTVMEGAVMQARSERSIEPYDASIRQLVAYLRGVLE